jgi:hypothetical protein
MVIEGEITLEIHKEHTLVAGAVVLVALEEMR